MLARRARTGAVLLGLTLALTASPAIATTEQEEIATPTAQTGQPQQQQQATPKRLRLTELGRFGDGSLGPARPGDVISFGLSVLNDGERTEDFVLTITLPPELTLLSLRQANFPDDPGDCSGNVCRGTVTAPINSGAERDFDSYEGKARLASSFRGDTTTIRADLQEDANPDPRSRISTLAVPVAKPAAGQLAGSTGTSGTGNAATATGTLPRTGERTTVTALLAFALLLLGVTAQVVGRRRPVTRGG